MKRLFPAACSFYLWPPPNRPIGVSKVGSPMRLLRKSPVFQTNLCPHGPVQTSQDSVGKSGRCSELRWFPLLSQLPKSDWGLQTLGSNHRGVFGPALVTSCYCYPICILFYPFVTRHPFTSYKHHIISNCGGKEMSRIRWISPFHKTFISPVPR